MRKRTLLSYSIVLCSWLLIWLLVPVRAWAALAQPSVPASVRLAPEQKVRPYVSAVNGVAFTLQAKGQGVAVVPLQSSMPVFKAFGLSGDQKKLLYTPLRNNAPSGELYLEDLSTGALTKLSPRVILQAAWSPVDDNLVACSFGGEDAFGIGVLQLITGQFTVLVEGNLLAESFRWDQSGKGIHYLEATGDATNPGVLPRYVPIDAPGNTKQAIPAPPTDFPVLEQPQTPALQTPNESVPALVMPDSSATVAPGDVYAFRARSRDGKHEVLGENVTGNGRLFLVGSPPRMVSVGEGQLVDVLDDGVVIRRFSTAGTSLDYVSWTGATVDLATSVLAFNLPLANPTLIQGGQGYAAPGNCNVGSHVNAMAYAYDLWNSAIGTHVMAAADGLVVFTASSVTCNTIDTDCPDYAAGGCGGTFFGNIVILQHSDGTYTKYAHMQPNSVQVAPGATVCQGLYIGRQGHTGSTNGNFNLCGDHVHFQRQSTSDIFGQSIAVDFADVPSNPLSCGTAYTSASVETSNSISPTSASFGIPGGSGSVTVTSTGCSWTAFSNDTWITITNAGSGSGNDVVAYSVADNSNSGARTGTMVIAGKTFVVSQNGGGVTNQAPVVNAGSDQTITLPAGAALNGTATDDGLPSPPGALSLLWTEVSGPGTVTFTSPQSLSTSASFSMAGVYVLRLTASDSALTSSDDVIVVVNTNSGTGSLAGSQVSPTSSVDLTAEGTSDWAHWGTVSATSFDHKVTGNSQISNYLQIGTITSVRYAGNSVGYSWSDGTPTSAASGANSGIYVYGIGNGFQLTVPADATTRTLKLYVGLYKAQGRLEATLSDGSASPVVDTSLVNQTGGSNTVFVLTYRAGGSAQSLTVRWTIGATWDPAANVTLQSATLALNGTGNNGQLLGSLVAAPVSVDLTAQGTLDWAHWGLTSASSFDHRAAVTSQIGNFVQVGSGSVGRQQASPTSYSWSNGTPTASASNTPTGVYKIGQATGFELTVPADTTARTLMLYVGLWDAQGKLEATLSDASAPSLSDTSLINQTATSNGLYTLTYQAGSPGRTLRVRWTVQASFNSFGNITLQAAALTTAGTPTNQAPTVNAGPDQAVTLPNSATLAGIASDDGLPSPPGVLTTTWSMVTGPGTVTFGNANSLNTTAGFSTAGSYTLRLTASDSVLSSTDDIIVTVNPANQAPTVNAGPDQAVTLPNSATLAGTASDDGLPNPPGVLTTTWSKVSGPGVVTFGNANALNTTASFSAGGSYTLRLTASDSVLTSTDDIIVTVTANQAPTVNAGPDQAVTLPNSATLAGTASDDGLPNPPGALTISWSMVTGPGTVTFGNANALNTTASFSTAGSYTLRLTASDSVLSSIDDMIVTVSAANQAPTVNAGPDQVVTLPNNATLAGTASDDGLPNPPGALTISWSMVTGPGTVTFGNANALNTTASFSIAGSYTLRLTASDSVLSSTDDMIVTVNPANQAPTVNAGPDQAVTLPNSATLAGTASDDGLPNPPGALTISWSMVIGPAPVTFGNANALNTTASFSAAGSYTLRLAASDSVLTSTDDIVITVNNNSGGVLYGNLATPGASVDLTAEGGLDWAHWGLVSQSSFDHRAGVTSQISNYTQIGSGAAQRQKASPTSYSWSNGTPTVSATNTPTGLYKIGTGTGFQLTLPADTTLRTLRLYVGLWDAQGRLEVTLSDFSAPALVDTSLINQTATSNGVYTLSYQAASAGQTLTVKWTVGTSFNSFGNVTLQAATVQ